MYLWYNIYTPHTYSLIMIPPHQSYLKTVHYIKHTPHTRFHPLLRSHYPQHLLFDNDALLAIGANGWHVGALIIAKICKI